MTTFTTRPELQGSFGMVSSTHYLASAVGNGRAGGRWQRRRRRRRGRVHPAGGRTAPERAGRGHVACCSPCRVGRRRCCAVRAPRPAAATVEAFTDLGLDEIPGSGPLAAAIPGSTVAWLTLLRDHGTVLARAVLGYAIHYAEHGFPVLPADRGTIARVERLFAAEWTRRPPHYLPDGRVPAGRVLVAQSDAGRDLPPTDGRARRGLPRERGIDAALERVALQDSWPRPSTSSSATPWMDTSGERHSGVLTGADMADWSASYEEPATVGLRAVLTVAKTGPWGQGPVLLQQLRLLDGMPLDDRHRRLRAHRRGGGQAGLRRPRRLLR